jgi:sulfur carrier protein
MNIQVNDQQRNVPDGTTIEALLQMMELEPRLVAVEVNLDVVPRTQHQQYVLRDGDRLEIVTLVGGG